MLCFRNPGQFQVLIHPIGVVGSVSIPTKRSTETEPPAQGDPGGLGQCYEQKKMMHGLMSVLWLGQTVPKSTAYTA